MPGIVSKLVAVGTIAAAGLTLAVSPAASATDSALRLNVYCKYDGNIRNAPYTSGRNKGRVVAQCKPDQWLPATCYVYGDSSNGTSLWYAWNKSGDKWFINASQVYTRGAGSMAKC